MSTDPKQGNTRCVVCLELITDGLNLCPHCDEHPGQFDYAAASPPSIAPGPAVQRGWWRQHWRPTVTIGLVATLLTAGIALRHLAPDRYEPPRRLNSPATAKAVCDTPCWASESCQLGKCVWQTPNDVTHLNQAPRIAGPIDLSEDFVDALVIDDERIAEWNRNGDESCDSPAFKHDRRQREESTQDCSHRPWRRNKHGAGNAFWSGGFATCEL